MKALLRRARVSQPLNFVMTTVTRGALRTLGVESDLVVRHMHRAGMVRCRLPNGRSMRLWSRGDDWVSNQIYWRGLDGYEPETVRLFFRLAATARVVFDVGAYVGIYTLLAAHANPRGRVYAFEPHPDAHPRLVRNVARNAVANVECLPVAAGDANGVASLWGVMSPLPTSSSLSREFAQGTEALRAMDVRVVRLDDFVRERALEGVDLVKIDTESTEPDVLRGMADTLRRERPAIICEVLAGRQTGPALEEMLGPLGYRYWLLTREGPRPATRIAGDPRYLNYLFACQDPA